MMIQEKLLSAKKSDWLVSKYSETDFQSRKHLAVIAAKIENARNELGLSQKDFARKMRVSQGMVSKWESGECNFSIRTLVDICTKLGLEFTPVITSKEYKPDNSYNLIRLPQNENKEWHLNNTQKREVIA